jgi:hypothetical protein
MLLLFNIRVSQVANLWNHPHHSGLPLALPLNPSFVVIEYWFIADLGCLVKYSSVFIAYNGNFTHCRCCAPANPIALNNKEKNQEMNIYLWPLPDRIETTN